MQNVMSAWTGLAPRKQLTVVLATVAIFAAVLWLSRLATQPNMELLYAGLEPAAAADVVAALDQQGASYEVRGDSIYAAGSDRDALRMTLAGQGLPANGVAGYELLDGLSGFGTTAQMFDAAYWRAKEGELARTMTASPMVRTARVHISNPTSQPFRRGANPTASVFVTPAGSALGGDQAHALRHLVAAAVAGLEPGDVSVIDSASGTVVDGTTGSAGGILDIEHATQLEASVQRLLEARVGAGRAVVEIAVEPRTDREQIVERRFDPESRVAISNETETRTSSSRGPAVGAVTVASEVPDGDANAQGAEDQTTQDSESRERTNYEVSETQREILREPGGIKRLTVAVLVDGTRETGPDGTEVFEARSEEELADLRDLVASAVGFDESRGDVITIKSLAFETLPSAADGSGPAATLPLDTMQLVQIGVLALVALALGLFVVRPILTGGGAAAEADALPAPGTQAIAVPEPPELPGRAEAGGFAGPTINTVSDFDVDFPDDDSGGSDMPALPGHEDPVARLRHMIEERKDETLEVLRGWMSEDRERAR